MSLTTLPSTRIPAALNLASAMLPIAVFYSITNILIGRPGSAETTDPLYPLLVTGGAVVRLGDRG